MRVRTWWVATALAGALVSGAAGCGGTRAGSGPGPADPQTTSPTPTAFATEDLASAGIGMGDLAPTTGALPPASSGSDVRAGHYLAVVEDDGSYRVEVVSRTTGIPMRVVASLPPTAGISPVLDADLSRDGTVWLVTRSDPGDPYSSSLARYSANRVDQRRQFVTSVAVSLDGTRVAFGVLSPDGDGDGRGTAALRIADTSGRILRTLTSFTFPATQDGLAAADINAPRPRTWLGHATVVTTHGSGAVSFVPATRPSSIRSWRTFTGARGTSVIGRFTNNGVLVAVPREARGDAPAGWDGYRVTPTDPRGAKVSSANTDSGLERVVAELLAVSGATPVAWTAPAYLPYEGTGRVVDAYA